MKEFDEDHAVEAMAQAVAPALRDKDALLEVLDLIFDYYEENGDLDIDADIDEDPDIDAMAASIAATLRKNGPDTKFSTDDIRALIKAEMDYEDSLL